MSTYTSKTFWVNPARAGMIPSRAFASQSKARKPRASGDDPRVGLLVGGQGG